MSLRSVLKLLEHWKQKCRESEYLFCNVGGDDRGGQVSSRNIQKTVSGYGGMAGIPVRVTPHTLRHTCATKMLRGGVNLRVIQEALGQSRVSVTQDHPHVVNDDVRRAMPP